MTDSGNNLAKGHVIKGGGVVILGQDQDDIPGDPAKFELVQSFVGSITGVNLWDNVQTQETIQLMSETCNTGTGNVLQWSEFLNTFHGDVIIQNPTACQVNK